MKEHGGYFGNDIDKVLDFSVNINSLGVPEKLINHIKSNLDNLVRYPEVDGISAKKSIANKLNISEEKIILGNGATELIYLFAKSIKFKNALIIQPTFTEYEQSLLLNEVNIFHLIVEEENAFKINIEKLTEEIETNNIDLLVFCNPNNPTGVFYDFEDLSILFDLIKEKNINLFIDESFIDFTDRESFIKYIDDYPLLLLRSMTKTYGIPGLRLGYAVGNTKIIKAMEKYKEPWTLNALALDAVDILLNDEEYYIKTKIINIENKSFLYNNLKTIKGIKSFHTEGNFILLKLENISGSRLKEKLLSYGIYIRTCTDFKGLNDSYIRIAIRNKEDNIKLINALIKIMEEYK